MGVPFVLGAPQPGRAQDCELGQPRLERGLEAHEGAELLGQLKLTSKQKDAATPPL
jgi:hypothetical protein